MNSKRVFLVLAATGVLAAVPASAATGVADPVGRPATLVRAPDKSYLTGLALAGRRLVAVGERGVILLSDDAGKTWRQAKAPSSVTLTAVQFPTPTSGWAVGHYGVVLHSADGGETWTRQLDGVGAAQIALRDAQAAAGTDAAAARARADAQRLVQDGPDKPFLALHFTDKDNGIVVGAYNLAFRTTDGGRTWTSLMGRLDNPRGNHLYAVQAAGDTVYIAGEQGLVLRSVDGGQRFDRVDTGYKGSFFAVALPRAGEAVVAGLRGNAFRSSDNGATWRRLEVPAPVSILAAGTRPDGTVVLGSQAGQLLTAAPGAMTLSPMKTRALPPVHDVVLLPGGALVVAGMYGPIRLPSPAAGTPESMGAR